MRSDRGVKIVICSALTIAQSMGVQADAVPAAHMGATSEDATEIGFEETGKPE